MYLKTSNKKQLAAAVTLAVMGTAWVAVPGQVWAADGGSQDHPRQYSSYTADSDRAIAIAREQKTGEDMYAPPNTMRILLIWPFVPRTIWAVKL